jgi:deoxyribonuclease IV
MDGFLFGTGGVPATVKGGDTIDGIADIARMSLDTLELEWVQGARLKFEKCDQIREASRKHGIALSVHAPYYINLAAMDPEKIESSIGRILESAMKGERAGATDIVFHPSFLMSRDRAEVEKLTFETYTEVIRRYEEANLAVTLRPELTGKDSAYGRLDEVLKMAREFPHTLPCIDWAHLHARTNGEWNTYDEWCIALKQIDDAIGDKNGLKRMHIHLSGINYTKAGERNHLPLEESDLQFRDLLRAMKEFNCAGRIICESPHAIMHEDALLLKNVYSELPV